MRRCIFSHSCRFNENLLKLVLATLKQLKAERGAHPGHQLLKYKPGKKCVTTSSKTAGVQNTRMATLLGEITIFPMKNNPAGANQLMASLESRNFAVFVTSTYISDVYESGALLRGSMRRGG